MKHLIATLSFLSAASLPGTLFAEFAGCSLPPACNSGSVFLAFVIATTLLIAFRDYARSGRVPVATTAASIASATAIVRPNARFDKPLAA